MGRRPFSVLGLVLLAGLATNASRGEEIEDLSFGESLYYAHQGKWFEALEQLNTQVRKGSGIGELERDMLWYQAVDADFSVGDFELNYRMHHRAVRIIQTVLEESTDETFHNNAAYHLARMHFRKGQEHDALRALDRISGKVPTEIRDDVAFLRASIYLAQEWSEPAIPLLRKLLKSKEYGAFATYNLGIAYLQGDLKKAAYDQLDRAGRMKTRNAADSAIRDKANLVLGTLLHEENQYNRAITYLNRVRLDGPFSNRALLSAGWASMSAGKPNSAMIPWSTLAERDATDRATQEAMLALPYAYGRLGIHSQAAVHYGHALDAYGGQIDKLNQSIDSIRAGRFLRALLRDEIREDEGWVMLLRSLPDAPETYYLMELLASNNFQTGLQNYLDLADLKRKLSARAASFAAYDELVALRESHYENLLPEIDEQFRELDSRLRQRREQHTTLLAQRDEMMASPPAGTEHQARLAEHDRNLQSLDDMLTLAQEQYDRYLLARKAARDSYTGYSEALGELQGHARETIDRIETLMTRQGQLLETLAIDELAARLRRLDVYASKARFGLADSYDRVKRERAQ